MQNTKNSRQTITLLPSHLSPWGWPCPGPDTLCSQWRCCQCWALEVAGAPPRKSRPVQTERECRLHQCLDTGTNTLCCIVGKEHTCTVIIHCTAVLYVQYGVVLRIYQLCFQYTAIPSWWCLVFLRQEKPNEVLVGHLTIEMAVSKSVPEGERKGDV